MKTTRRQFLKGLLATAATAAIAPQVLVERVHGSSDLTARERDVVADVMGLRQRQWPGYVDLTWRARIVARTEDVFRIQREAIWSARVVNAKEGEIVVSSSPAALFGIPSGRGVFREDQGDLFFGEKDDPKGGYLIPEEYRQRIIDALNQEWDRQFLEGSGRGQPLGVLSLGDYGTSPVERFVRANWTESNLYDSESKIV